MTSLNIGMSTYEAKQFELLLDVWRQFGWNNKGYPMVHKLYFRFNPFQHDSLYIKDRLVCKIDCQFCKLSGAEDTCTQYLKRNKGFVVKKMKNLKKKESPSEKRRALFTKRMKEEKKMQLLLQSKRKVKDPKKKSERSEKENFALEDKFQDSKE